MALQAPSGANRQAWHWMVITDENIRQVIGDYYRQAVSSYLNSSGSAAALFADDPERSAVQRRVAESVAYLGEHMGEVPVLVIPCISAPHLRAGSQAGLWGSLLPAAWSYMLAARARGLGTAWTTLHLETEEGLRTAGNSGRHPAWRPRTTAYYIGDAFKPRHVSRWTPCSTSTPGR